MPYGEKRIMISVRTTKPEWVTNTAKATATTPVSVTASGNVKKPNDVTVERNGHRYHNHIFGGITVTATRPVTDTSNVRRPDETGIVTVAVRRYGPRYLSRLMSAIFFVLCILLCCSINVDAKMKGRCKDCHSMHAITPFPVLTKGGCVGCHGKVPNGTENIITIGKVRIPQILHHMEDGDLASGNFYYVADGYNPDYFKGHNVLGISHQESIPTMNMPPGFIGDVVIPGGKGPVYWSPEQQLTCSGTWGCHGNRTIEDPYLSLYKAHHTHTGEIDGSTVGKSYRFLYGITGVEHPDWEYEATIDNHNGYKGDFNHNTIDTISYLCGECHGKFHPNPNLGGSKEVGFANFITWVRHPADISFSTVHGGFAGSEYQGYVTYSLESPVAYFNPTGREKVVDADSILMCMSCHRAHASNYADALRWDYSKITVGSTQKEGCLTCHTQKGGHQ